MARPEFPAVMNPFTLHREAFASLGSRDTARAEAGFNAAMQAFARWLEDPASLRVLEVRARMIPGQAARARGLAESLIDVLPEWLRDFHFEAFYQALTTYDVPVARMHWGLLDSASRLDRFRLAFDLATMRQQVCHRQQLTSDIEATSARPRRDLLRRGERVLRVDPANAPVLTIIAQAYGALLNEAFDAASRWQRRRNIGGQAPRSPAAARRSRSAVLQAPGAARRLRRHLLRPGAADTLGRDVFLDAHEKLFRYYLSTSQIDDARRILRRVRRLSPADDGTDGPGSGGGADVRQWRRILRRAARRR
jgi:hypothetical protein